MGKKHISNFWCLHLGDKIVTASTNKTYEVENIGILYPERVPTGALYVKFSFHGVSRIYSVWLKPAFARYTGQVGYVIAAMRSTKEARVGDTLFKADHPVEPLPGFKPAQPMVSPRSLIESESLFSYTFFWLSSNK